MPPLMSRTLLVFNNNRRMQRKANTGFAKVGLPLAKKSGEILEPVSPLVAQRFQAQLEREVKRREMVTGLVLIILTGISAALFLLCMGLF